MDIDVEVYDKSESLNKRIRTAEEAESPICLGLWEIERQKKG